MSVLTYKLDILLFARDDYLTARKNVPNYTGHLTEEDYYKTELKAYEEALADFAQEIRDTL